MEKRRRNGSNSLLGAWSRESVVILDEQTNSEATEWTCEKLGSAIIAKGPTSDGGASADMMAWDGFHECLYEFGKLSSGDSWNIQFNVISADKLHGVATGALEDGRRGNGVCVIRKKGDDAYEAVFELILDDGSVFRQKDINMRKKESERTTPRTALR